MKKYLVHLFILGLIAFPILSGGVTSADQYEPVSVRSYNHIDTIELPAETLGVDDDFSDYVYTSNLIISDIDAWMVGAGITLIEASDAHYDFAFQYSSDNYDWSQWIPLEFSERDQDQSHLYIDPYALDQKSNYFRYQLHFPNEYKNEINNIKEIKLVTLDPTEENNSADFSLFSNTKAQESIDIITREEWGADESIMFWDDDMEHAKIDQVVIHHTATNDNSPIDPQATIRGIYYFHTVEKGWGDIGYNYLVDQHGNIYEGRKGGLGVVAAHAYGFNAGSVGISVLGNYEAEYPADQSIDAVADLISFVSFQTDLDLQGSMTQDDEIYDAVVGHRDVDATACPGNKFYELIPDIIEQAVEGSQNDGEKSFLAEHKDQSSYYVELYDDQKESITIEYKNIGNAAWLEGQNEVTLVTSGQIGRDSKFADSEWVSTSQVGDMYQYTAMPGGVGVFNLELTGIKEKGNFLEKFSLMSPDGIIADTEFSILINNLGKQGDPDQLVKPKNNYGISAARYRAEIYDNIGDVNIESGTKKKVWIEYTNTGDNIWYNINPFPMHLGATNPPDTNSIFYSSSDWLTANRINLLQTYVSPGEVGHFEFTLDATHVSPGTYSETFSPVIEHLNWIDAPVTLKITVT